MKVRVQFTVDVDPQQYCDAFGDDQVDLSRIRGEIRTFAKDATDTWVEQHQDAPGVIAEDETAGQYLLRTGQVPPWFGSAE